MSTYFAIQSKLSGNVIDIQEASTKPGALLDAFSQKTTGSDNQLWEFIPDPAGSGYYFIRSKLSGNVIDILQASTKPGARLQAFSQKARDFDNQLWRVVDGAFPGPVYTSISWEPEGTGPAPNSSTIYSGGNKCAYQVGVAINQDGSCTLSGYYQNRGDVWWGTAPSQGFVAAFFVYDTSGKCYALSYSGVIPSAPQSGSLVTWNVTQKCPVIAENAKNRGLAFAWNTYDESVWSVLGGWLSNAASDLGTLVTNIVQALDGRDGGGDGGGDYVSELVIKRTSLPPLPAGAPAGAAATGHQAGAPLAGKGK